MFVPGDWYMTADDGEIMWKDDILYELDKHDRVTKYKKRDEGYGI